MLHKWLEFDMLKGYSMLCEVDPWSRGRDLNVSILQVFFGPRGTAVRGWDDFIMVSEF